MMFVLWALVAVVALVAASSVILAAVTYVQRVQDDESFHPCCPPGAGCNDGSNRLCRRSMAQRLADFEEGVVLDRRWVAFRSVPAWRPVARRRALASYAAERDDIIDRQIRKVGVELGELRPQLPSHSEVLGLLQSDTDMKHGLQGEVMDP